MSWLCCLTNSERPAMAERRLPSSWFSPLARLTAILIAAWFIAVVSDAEAAKRGRHRSSAAAAAARKKAMIATIRRQIAVAEQALAAAETQGDASQTVIDATLGTLTETRKAIEDAGQEEKAASRRLREIEGKLLASSDTQTRLREAQRTVDQSRATVDQALHQVVPLPDHQDNVSSDAQRLEKQSLTATDRERLRSDPGYQAALQALAKATQELNLVRSTILAQNPDWIAASKAVQEADRKEREAKKAGNTGSLQSLPARKNLRTAQEVAAYARAIIADGQAKLRMLGVKDAGTRR